VFLLFYGERSMGYHEIRLGLLCLSKFKNNKPDSVLYS
jgi:hypothetical protein